jgi:hypothetical protein
MAGDCVPRFRSTDPEILRSQSDVSGGCVELPVELRLLSLPHHPKHAFLIVDALQLGMVYPTSGPLFQGFSFYLALMPYSNPIWSFFESATS